MEEEEKENLSFGRLLHYHHIGGKECFFVLL